MKLLVCDLPCGTADSQGRSYDQSTFINSRLANGRTLKKICHPAGRVHGTFFPISTI